MEDRVRFLSKVLLIAAVMAFFCMTVLLPPSLSAAEIGDYSFELLPDGTPRFTQILHWEADVNVLYYEITLQTASGRQILIDRLEQPMLELNLRPGEYRYRIVYYNLLREPEVELPWQEFTVLKAEIPRIEDHTPAKWFIEDPDPVVTISGERLMPGSTVMLKKRTGPAVQNTSAGAITCTEVERRGNTSVRVTFPCTLLTAGVYDLELTNPGGLSFTVGRALSARHKLPAPEGLNPAPGTVFGTEDLRRLKALHFRWDAVPEATHYTFSLYQGTIQSPLIRKTYVRECEWTLDDLSVLDRGEFRWTVEAVAKNGDEIVIPSAKTAVSVFRIDLPEIQPPKVKTGEVFYGG